MSVEPIQHLKCPSLIQFQGWAIKCKPLNAFRWALENLIAQLGVIPQRALLIGITVVLLTSDDATEQNDL